MKGVYKRNTTHYMGPMASLNSPLSVRLSDEDTNFLAELEIDGAVTASDKIRGLIRQARQRAEKPESFAEALAISHDRLGATIRALRIVEQEVGVHSDVSVGLLAAAEEFLALALIAPRSGEDDAAAELKRHEARLVDCATRLAEQLLRWAVTPTAPAYDPTVVARRMAGLTELMRIICASSDAR